MTSSGVPEDHKPCCVASRAGFPQDTGLSALRTPRVAGTASASKRATAEMVQLEGGEFLMSADDPFGFPADGEGPNPVFIRNQEQARSKMSFFPTKILLATDGSEEAELAAQSAVQLANETGSELHVMLVGPSTVTSVGLAGSPGVGLVGSQQDVDKEAKRSLEAQVEKSKAGGGMVAQSHYRVGRPDHEIVAVAEEIGAGLIVMASRGLGGIRRALMGRVSSSVVRHAHCPVLIVRGEKDGKPPFSAKRILLATDGSGEAALAAQATVDLANKTNSEIHVVHVTMPLYASRSGYEGVYVADYISEEDKDLERSAQELLDEQAKKIKAAGGSVAETHLRTGKPAQEIVDLAEEIGTGLILMGSRGLGGIRGVLMGSVSDLVVRHAHCPVLVVRKEEPTD
jgi:nucleotide-binding universal stress UspA family protein